VDKKTVKTENAVFTNRGNFTQTVFTEKPICKVTVNFNPNSTAQRLVIAVKNLKL